MLSGSNFINLFHPKEGMVEDRNILSDFCTKFCNIIKKHCVYAVVSGFFVISSGRSRGTEDIDIIIERLSFDRFKKLHKDLINNNFNCLQSDDAAEVYDYLEEGVSVRYILGEELLPEIELKFAKDTLDEYQLKTRVKEKATGVDVFFSSIECNVAFKEELLKSKKDLDDAGFLRILYKEKIDEKEVKKIKAMIKRYRL